MPKFPNQGPATVDKRAFVSVWSVEGVRCGCGIGSMGLILGGGFVLLLQKRKMCLEERSSRCSHAHLDKICYLWMLSCRCHTTDH